MVVISTSGFQYDDWIGRFYPNDLGKGDLLPWFAKFFSAVELNYSYYTHPGKKGIDGHMRKAPGMKFSLKGHSNFTHERDYGQQHLAAYKAALDQLAEGGALLSFLLQFPYSFHATTENRHYLDTLLENFKEYPVAVEFRHANWKSHVTYNQIAQHDCALVITDAPDLPNLYRGGWEAVGPFSYVRLHGRNAEQWWEHEHGWQRYDYFYSQEQIRGMAKAVRELEGEPKGSGEKKDSDPREVYIFFNNHWQAQGAINALQLSLELGMKTPEDLPDFMAKILTR